MQEIVGCLDQEKVYPVVWSHSLLPLAWHSSLQYVSSERGY